MVRSSGPSPNLSKGPDMPHWLGLILLLLAAFQIGFGALIESRQRRERGPVAIVPTVPHAVGASISAALGCSALTIGGVLSWWLVPVAFVSTLAVATIVIVYAGRIAQP
jgi:tellurite resistance protein TehA-like permease